MKTSIYVLMLICALTIGMAFAQNETMSSGTENETLDNITAESYNDTISILEVSYLPVEQYVRLLNVQDVPQNLTGYVLGIIENENFLPIYTFEEFTLDANSTVTVHAGSGTDSQTDLYTGNETMFTEEPALVYLENGGDYPVAVWPSLEEISTNETENATE